MYSKLRAYQETRKEREGDYKLQMDEEHRFVHTDNVLFLCEGVLWEIMVWASSQGVLVSRMLPNQNRPNIQLPSFGNSESGIVCPGFVCDGSPSS